MAPKIPQLHTLPWPAFVGASVLLHIGVLSFSLPRMLEVGQPADSTAHIPITLVDDDIETSGATSSSPQLATAPSPAKAIPQTVPVGGQNIAAEPVQQPPQSEKPAQPTPVDTQDRTSETTSPKPANEAKKPDNTQNVNEQAPPTRQPPTAPPGSDTEATNETGDGQSRALTQVTISGEKIVFYLAGEVDGTPKANFRPPIVLDIPSANSCQRNVSPSSSLQVEIRNGREVFPLDGAQSTAPEKSVAACLLQAATTMAPNAISYDVRPNTPFDDVAGNSIPSIAVEFTLRFN